MQIITEPDSVHIGRLKHKTYAVDEFNGVVFVFIGDLDPPPPLERDLQPKFKKGGGKLALHPVARNKSRANWRIAAENGFDAAHIYGHCNAGMFKAAPDIQLALSTYPSTKEAVTIIDEDDATCGIVKLDDLNIWTSEIEGITITGANVDPDNPPQEPAEFEVGLWMPCGLEVEPFPLPGMMHFEWYTPIDEDHHAYMICCAKEVHSAEEEAEFHKVCEEIAGPDGVAWSRQSNRTCRRRYGLGLQQLRCLRPRTDPPRLPIRRLLAQGTPVPPGLHHRALAHAGRQTHARYTKTRRMGPHPRLVTGRARLRPAETQLTRLPGTSL